MLRLTLKNWLIGNKDIQLVTSDFGERGQRDEWNMSKERRSDLEALLRGISSLVMVLQALSF